MRIIERVHSSKNRVQVGGIFIITLRKFTRTGVCLDITNLRSGYTHPDVYRPDKLHRIGVGVAFKYHSPANECRHQGRVEWYLDEQHTFTELKKVA